MSDSERLLELIENGIVEHGGDLGGWTRRVEDTLQLFDGRVTLRVVLEDDGENERDGRVHAHVLARLCEYDEELDACVVGLGEDRESSLGEAAVIWITGVAGPIKSFLDNKPVCSACPADANGFDFGFLGVTAFVGASIGRGIDDEQVQAALDGRKPWFRYAAAAASPRSVHLAKATIASRGKDGWCRDLEVDGHEVAYKDASWPAGIHGPDVGYLVRFAVFAFPRDSTEIARRAELERTIEFFSMNFAGYESVDELLGQMVEQGFDADLVHEVESISTIAFGRVLFEHRGVQYSPSVIRARRDGRIEMDVPLMTLPAYTRARALASSLYGKMPKDVFQSLCCYSAESNGILQAMDGAGEDFDFSGLRLYPCVVPERGVSDETMDGALAALNELLEQSRSADKKPWWKFW